MIVHDNTKIFPIVSRQNANKVDDVILRKEAHSQKGLRT